MARRVIVHEFLDTSDVEQMIDDAVADVTKTSIGLGDVDNTSDLSKPVSTATQSALDGKSDIGHNHDGSYSPLGHEHDDRYYTESEVDGLLGGIVTDPLPDQMGQNGKFLSTDGTDAEWVAIDPSPVDSVNGLYGDVLLDVADIPGAAASSSLATVATSGSYGDLSGTPTLGTAAASDTGDFAAAAHNHDGTYVKPGDLATVATSGDYDDLSGTPSLGTAAAASTGDFATAAQGSTADTAVQPGDLGDLAFKDKAAVADIDATGTASGTTYLRGDGSWSTPAGGGGAVDSVNGQTGVVVLDADDIDDAATTNKFVTSGDITKLGNLSGTNTGDQDLSGYATTASVTASLAGKADATHTHPQSDVTNLTSDLAGKAPATTLTAALPSTVGTNGQVLKSNGTAVTWQTDANTTYSEITSAEITAGTATTARAISGRRAQEIVNKARAGLADTSSLAVVATSGNYSDLSGKPTLGTAAAADTEDFATAAQGAAADTAVQPGDLATVATTGDYNDLTNKPTIPTAPVQSVNSQIGHINLTAADVGAVSPSDISNVAVSGSYNDLYDRPPVSEEGETSTPILLLQPEGCRDTTGSFSVGYLDGSVVTGVYGDAWQMGPYGMILMDANGPIGGTRGTVIARVSGGLSVSTSGGNQGFNIGTTMSSTFGQLTGTASASADTVSGISSGWVAFTWGGGDIHTYNSGSVDSASTHTSLGSPWGGSIMVQEVGGSGGTLESLAVFDDILPIGMIEGIATMPEAWTWENLNYTDFVLSVGAKSIRLPNASGALVDITVDASNNLVVTTV